MNLTWEAQLGAAEASPTGLVAPNCAYAVHMPWIQVVTWNDWPERTSVEPSDPRGYGLLTTHRFLHKLAVLAVLVVGQPAWQLLQEGGLPRPHGRRCRKHRVADPIVSTRSISNCTIPNFPQSGVAANQIAEEGVTLEAQAPRQLRQGLTTAIQIAHIHRAKEGARFLSWAHICVLSIAGVQRKQ